MATKPINGILPLRAPTAVVHQLPLDRTDASSSDGSSTAGDKSVPASIFEEAQDHVSVHELDNDGTRNSTMEDTGLHDLTVLTRVDDAFVNGSHPSAALDRNVKTLSAQGSMDLPISEGPRSEVQMLITIDKCKVFMTQPNQDWAQEGSGVVQESHAKAGASIAQSMNMTQAKFTFVPTFQNFRSLVTNLRLRHMAHQGSTLDRTLKRAEVFAQRLNDFASISQGRNGYMLGSARLVWSCAKAILQMPGISLEIQEKAFLVFQAAGEILDFFIISHRSLRGRDAPELRNIIALVAVTFTQLCSDLTLICKKAMISVPATTSSGHFAVGLEPYFEVIGFCRDRFVSNAWRLCLSGSEYQGIGYFEFREWLGSTRVHISRHLSELLSVRTSQEEFTFEWFIPKLQNFMSSLDDILMVTGTTGCGKSTLKSFILEHMKDSTQHSKSKTLSLTLDPLSASRSPLDVIKGLLLGLLESCADDDMLLKDLSRAYTRRENEHTSGGLSLLWEIFGAAIRRQKHDMLVVVDGLDHVIGGAEVAKGMTDQIQEVVHSHRHLRFIILARPYYSRPSRHVCSFDLDRSELQEDVRRFMRRWVRGSSFLASLTYKERTTVIERLMRLNIRNFLDARLLLRMVEREANYVAIGRLLDIMSQRSTRVNDVLCSRVNLAVPKTWTILSVLMVAKRPMTVKEVSALINDGRTSITSLAHDLEKDIIDACGPIIEIRDGFVRFTHSSIKASLLSARGTFGNRIGDAHKEITLRSLAVIKSMVSDVSMDPSLDFNSKTPQIHHLNTKIKENSILEYAIQYYLVHYRASPLFDEKTKHPTNPLHFQNNFPDCVLATFAECNIWDDMFSLKEVESMHQLALNLRRSILGDMSKSVIQSHLNVLWTHQRLSQVSSALLAVFDAWTLSKRVLGERNHVTIELAQSFITLTKTNRNELLVHQRIHLEKLFSCLLLTLKHLYGGSDHGAIATVYREIYEYCMTSFGSLHDITSFVTEKFVQCLQELSLFEQCIEVCQGWLGKTSGSIQIWSERRVHMVIQVMRTAELQGALKRAEEVVITLREELIKACESSIDERLHTAFLEISLEYAGLLRRCGRSKECTRTLLQSWQMFELSHKVKLFEAAAIRHKMRQISEQLLELKMFEEASTILRRLHIWYNENSKATGLEAILVVISLADCHNCANDTSAEEELLQGLFEVILSQRIISSLSITTCIRLSTIYKRTLRLNEAIKTCTRMLQLFWSSILEDGEPDSSLTLVYGDDAVRLATTLATYYVMTGRTWEATKIHVSIYQSYKAVISVHDFHFVECAKRLADFYEHIHDVEATANLWIELRQELAISVGNRHKNYMLVSLYLAQLYQRQHRSGCESIYLDIFTIRSSRGATFFNSWEIDAFVALCELYEQQNRLSELQEWYSSLWVSWRRYGEECGMSKTMALSIITKYVTLLEKTEGLLVSIEFARSFHSTCVLHYGSHDVSSLQVAMLLAQLALKDKRNHDEVIRIYEEISRIHFEFIVEKEVIAVLIAQARANLAALYKERHGMTARAEKIYFEIWKETKRRYGCAHEQTLIYLGRVVEFLRDEKSAGHHGFALKVLQDAIVEILALEKNSHKLFAAAQSIARIYISLNARSAAMRLIHDIRTFFVNNRAKAGSLDVSKLKAVDCRSFMFIFSLEAFLRGGSRDGLFVEIMEEVVTETSLYESWIRALNYNTDLETRLNAGAQLLTYLRLKERHDECRAVENEMWVIFRNEFDVSANKTGAIWELFCVYSKGDRQTMPSTSMFDTFASAIISYYRDCKFQLCIDTTKWFISFAVEKGAFKVEEFCTLAFSILSSLSGPRPTGAAPSKDIDGGLKEVLSDLTKCLLRAGLLEHIEIATLSLEGLNVIVKIIGQQEDFTNLEAILRSLWESRMTLQIKTSEIIMIGCRLCEAQFAHGNHGAAIALAEDIYYNSRDIFGPINPLTERMTSLLASFQVKCGNLEKAMSLHCELLGDTISRTHDGVGDAEERKRVLDCGLRQGRLLKITARRRGPQDSADVSGLLDQYKKLVGEKDSRWGELNGVDEWVKKESKGKPLANTESFGCWEKPKNWGFLEEERFRSGWEGQIEY